MGKKKDSSYWWNTGSEVGSLGKFREEKSTNKFYGLSKELRKRVEKT